MKNEELNVEEREITPEMISAGEEVLDVYGELLAPSLLARRVYIAMRKLESDSFENPTIHRSIQESAKFHAPL